MSANENMNFTEERLRLEREALEIERERLNQARQLLEAKQKLAMSSHPHMFAIAVSLLALLCFAGGLITGIAVMETRQERRREARLAKALSQINDVASSDVTVTNAPSPKVTTGTHPNVSVVVIE